MGREGAIERDMNSFHLKEIRTSQADGLATVGLSFAAKGEKRFRLSAKTLEKR